MAFTIVQRHNRASFGSTSRARHTDYGAGIFGYLRRWTDYVFPECVGRIMGSRVPLATLHFRAGGATSKGGSVCELPKCGGHANGEREAGDGFHADESPSDASIGRDCGRHGTGVDGGTHEDGGNVVGGGPSEIPLNQDELPRQALPIQSPPDPPRERVLEDGLYLQEDSQQSMHFSRELSELAGAYTATIAILAHRRLACNWPHGRKILSSTPTTQGTWRRLFLSVWSRSTNSLQWPKRISYASGRSHPPPWASQDLARRTY